VRKLKQQGIKFSFQRCADEEDQQVKAKHTKLAAAPKGACATFLGLLISYEAGVAVNRFQVYCQEIEHLYWYTLYCLVL
jgi:hypothetical protein